MNCTQLLGVVALLAFCSCNKDNDTNPAAQQQIPPIDLLDPQVGQRSSYVRLTLAANDTTAVQYPDTLHLEIAQIDALGTLEVIEYLSDHSAAHQGQSTVPYSDRVLTFQLSPKPAALEVIGSSRLFPSYTPDEQAISYMASEQLGMLVGDRIETDYLPMDRTLTLTNSSYSADLQHEHRADGLPGLTFVHDRQRGLVLGLVEYDLAGNADGWRLLDSTR